MNVKLSFIADEISAGNCLVILGPRLLAKEEPNINAQLNAFLTENLGDEVSYYTEDGLLNFDPDERDFLIRKLIKEFYEGLEPPEIYQKIAEIPFSLIINTSPDKLLNKVFDEKNREYDYDYYKMYKGTEKPPKQFATLLYNIFGDYEDMDSMILTFKDLSKYMHSIMESEPDLKKKLKDVRAILFFGFSYDKWYFQLLLSMLRLEKKRKSSWEIPKGNLKNFYMGEFKMKFFSDHTAGEIIDELHKATLDGIIRPPEIEEAPPTEIYISYAWGGESEKIAESMEASFKKNKLHLIRDKTELLPKERISKFMERIGKADGVVVVISKKYLKSPYCMFELVEIYKNKNFETRIYPIILEDAEIFSGIDRLDYKQYWQDEVTKLDAKFKAVGGEAADTILDDYKLSKRIYDSFDEIVNTLKDMLSFSPEAEKKSDFEGIIKSIKTTLR